MTQYQEIQPEILDDMMAATTTMVQKLSITPEEKIWGIIHDYKAEVVEVWYKHRPEDQVIEVSTNPDWPNIWVYIITPEVVYCFGIETTVT